MRFIVLEPFEVPLHQKKALQSELLKPFLTKHEKYLNNCGCYIFAVPRKYGAKGLLPIYVGKATKTFGCECFTPDKITKINDYLLNNPTSKLFLFLIKHPDQRGKTNARIIHNMEKDLTRLAVTRNPSLINKKNIKPAEWSIAGVIRSDRGKPSNHALKMRELLGLDGISNLQD